MNELEMFDKLQWWCLKSTHPNLSPAEKKFYQNKLNKVVKLVEELNESI